MTELNVLAKAVRDKDYDAVVSILKEDGDKWDLWHDDLEELLYECDDDDGLSNEILKKIIETYKCLPGDHRDDYTLYKKAILTGDTDFVEMLVAHRFDINDTDEDSLGAMVTVLDLALDLGNPNMVESLLKHGAKQGKLLSKHEATA